MVRLVKREYLVDLVEQYYKERECYFCGDSNCNFCKKKTKILEQELRKKNNTCNSDVIVWKISYYQNDQVF